MDVTSFGSPGKPSCNVRYWWILPLIFSALLGCSLFSLASDAWWPLYWIPFGFAFVALTVQLILLVYHLCFGRKRERLAAALGFLVSLLAVGSLWMTLF